MSQPHVQPLPRRKLPKHTSSNNIHKQKDACNLSEDAEEKCEEVKRSPEVRNRNAPETSRVVEKTTSRTHLAGRKLWNNPARIFGVARSQVNNTINEESELITMLTRQLYLAETQVQKVQECLTKAEERLRVKEQEIGRLKRKVKDWEMKNKCQEVLRKKDEQQRRNQIDNSEYLYKRCLVLEQKIFEMEKFLSDYGLVWVGEENKNSKAPESIANDYINNCYDELAASIDQLNFAAGKGELHVHRDEKNGKASFKTPSCMSLRFFKDGMILQNGPLRPYTDPATGRFIRDILDGYFPSELQRNYPNGVPFKMEDRRSEIHGVYGEGFPGHGYKLGKQISIDKRPSFLNNRKINKNSKRAPKQNFSIDIVDVFNDSKKDKMTPSSARSLKSKSSLDTPVVDILNLRTQILASHNNNCSDTHLQSHINAELALSSRRERRDLATKTADYDLPMPESPTKSRIPSRLSSAGRSSHHSSTDRSSLASPGRPETPQDQRKSRVRSTRRLAGNPVAKGRTTPRGDSGDSKASSLSSNTSLSRLVKSTHARRGAPPILHQVNEPTGRDGELRLKVRSLNGGTIYMIHVSADESAASLYRLLNKAMARTSSKGYKIVVSGYSPKRLDQSSMTLRESGITRDCVLHLVND